MKILAITDIHQNDDAARSAAQIESPDLVLDCGDHEQLMNLFGSTPHLYIRGNHEPLVIAFRKEDYPLPIAIPNGDIIEFTHGAQKIAITGIDGNYGTKDTVYQVNPRVVNQLKKIDPGVIDILLLHESPLNVNKSSRDYPLARLVLEEIHRLRPKLVLSGHTGRFSELTTDQNVKFVNLDDMNNGYATIAVQGPSLILERKIACYGSQ